MRDEEQGVPVSFSSTTNEGSCASALQAGTLSSLSMKNTVVTSFSFPILQAKGSVDFPKALLL